MAYTHADVVDWAAGVSAVPEVAAATAQRHNRLHSLTSISDHFDVFASVPIAEGSVLQYSSARSRWEAVILPSPASQNKFAETFLLMGG